MSTRVGDESGFVDTQGLEVENTTDGLIYDQVLSVSPANADHNMNFHQLTNDTVDKTFSLTNAAFDVVMMVTQPELTALLNLSVPIAGLALVCGPLTLKPLTGIRVISLT